MAKLNKSARTVNKLNQSIWVAAHDPGFFDTGLAFELEQAELLTIKRTFFDSFDNVWPVGAFRDFLDQMAAKSGYYKTLKDETRAKHEIFGGKLVSKRETRVDKKARKSFDNQQLSLLKDLVELGQGKRVQEATLRKFDAAESWSFHREKIEKAIRSTSIAETLVVSQMAGALQIKEGETKLNNKKIERIRNLTKPLEENKDALNKQGYMAYLFERTFDLANGHTFEISSDGSVKVFDETGALVTGEKLIPGNENAVIRVNDKDGDKFARSIAEFQSFSMQNIENSPRKIADKYESELKKKFDKGVQVRGLTGSLLADSKKELEKKLETLQKKADKELYKQTGAYRDHQAEVYKVKQEIDAERFALYNRVAGDYETVLKEAGVEELKETFIYSKETGLREKAFKDFESFSYPDATQQKKFEKLLSSDSYKTFKDTLLKEPEVNNFGDADFEKAQAERIKAFESFMQKNPTFASSLEDFGFMAITTTEPEELSERATKYREKKRERVQGLPGTVNAIKRDAVLQALESYKEIGDKTREIQEKYTDAFLKDTLILTGNPLLLPTKNPDGTYNFYDPNYPENDGMRTVDSLKDVMKHYSFVEDPKDVKKIFEDPSVLHGLGSMSEEDFFKAVNNNQLVPKGILKHKESYDSFINKTAALDTVREAKISEVEKGIDEMFNQANTADGAIGKFKLNDDIVITVDKTDGVKYQITNGDKTSPLFDVTELASIKSLDEDTLKDVIATKLMPEKLKELEGLEFNETNELVDENGQPVLNTEELQGQFKKNVAKLDTKLKKQFTEGLTVTANQRQNGPRGQQRNNQPTAQSGDPQNNPQNANPQGPTNGQNNPQNANPQGPANGQNNPQNVNPSAGGPVEYKTNPFVVPSVNVAGIVKYLQVKQCMSYDLIAESAERLARQYAALASTLPPPKVKTGTYTINNTPPTAGAQPNAPTGGNQPPQQGAEAGENGGQNSPESESESENDGPQGDSGAESEENGGSNSPESESDGAGSQGNGTENEGDGRDSEGSESQPNEPTGEENTEGKEDTGSDSNPQGKGENGAGQPTTEEGKPQSETDVEKKAENVDKWKQSYDNAQDRTQKAKEKLIAKVYKAGNYKPASHETINQVKNIRFVNDRVVNTDIIHGKDIKESLESDTLTKIVVDGKEFVLEDLPEKERASIEKAAKRYLDAQRKEEWNRKRYENAESVLEQAQEQAGTQDFTQATHAQAGASNPENTGESATAENTTKSNMSDNAAEANSGDFDLLFNIGNNGASSPENTGESIGLSGSENTQQEENISFSTSGFGEGAQAGNQDGVTGAEAQNEGELDFDFLSDFEEVAMGSGDNDTGAESSEEEAGYDNISIDASPITGPESAEDFRKRLQAELNGQGLEQNFAQGIVGNSEQSQNGGATVVDANEFNFEP